MAVLVGNGNSKYPPEEDRISRQLVRMIRTAETWQEMVEASEALFQVELRARTMRDEKTAQHQLQQNIMAQGVKGVSVQEQNSQGQSGWMK